LREIEASLKSDVWKIFFSTTEESV
jgi:hypothetical protein